MHIVLRVVGRLYNVNTHCHTLSFKIFNNLLHTSSKNDEVVFKSISLKRSESPLFWSSSLGKLSFELLVSPLCYWFTVRDPLRSYEINSWKGGENVLRKVLPFLCSISLEAWPVRIPRTNAG